MTIFFCKESSKYIIEEALLGLLYEKQALIKKQNSKLDYKEDLIHFLL